MRNKTYKIWLLMLSISILLANSLRMVYAQEISNEIPLNDLSIFNNPSKSWSIVQDVYASIDIPNKLTGINGTGNILVNIPSKKVQGEDLFTKVEYGDMELKLKFLMSKNGNSGIYLQGRYEVQLEDSWNLSHSTSASNGGIYDLIAPRINSSKAPGLWQDLKISFRAPRFNSANEKIENARILKVELNGVIVQENVELFKPTPGAVSNKEVNKAPLRIQGDHGAIAFKDLVISDLKKREEDDNQRLAADPILVESTKNTILRSFVDLDNKVRVVHAISVGSPKNVHYTYDMDHGMLVQMWRGKFLDATSMWDGRGNGTAIPMGAVQRLGKPVLELVSLSNQKQAWPMDTVGSSYKPKGYVLNSDGIPTFKYNSFGAEIQDKINVLTDGTGIEREISIENGANIYFRLAKSEKIEEIQKGYYLIGDKGYYLKLNNPKSKVIIREVDGEKELIAPINTTFIYSILF